jgi:hypothetical protein
MNTIDVAYLIPYLRIKLGDTDSTKYRYLDEWLTASLVMAVKAMQPYWNYRYLVDSKNLVFRNPQFLFWVFPETDGVIQQSDEYLIVLMATIITLEGTLENYSWNMQSWADAEIRFTNLDSGKMKDSNLNRLWAEFQNLVTSPNKKLARARKGSLPGFRNNPWENKQDL